ncbi:MAG: histidinol-phosphate aminotransferase [Myxococcota bacterium]|jgi:histidinol-phosphate aminotransferase
MQLVADGLDPSAIDDFSATTLPVPSPPAVRAVLTEVSLTAYPDPACTRLRQAIGERHDLPMDHILCANGSVALIHAAARCCLAPGHTALIVGPTFGEYRLAIDLTGAQAIEVVTEDVEAVLAAVAEHRPRLLFLCNPNNPTGKRWSADDIDRIAETVFVILDEAYAGFLRPTPAPGWGSSRLVLRSLTKDRGLAGLRIGYAVAAPAILRPLSVVLTPWGVNHLAQLAALAVLDCEAPFEDAIDAMWVERERLIGAIEDRGLTVEQGAAPFFLVVVPDATQARTALLAHGVLVRDCTSLGLPQRIRISPRTPDAGERLLAAIDAVFSRPAPALV